MGDSFHPGTTTWICAICRKVNSVHDDTCPNPDCLQQHMDVAISGNWLCEKCNTENVSYESACAQCGHEHPLGGFEPGENAEPGMGSEFNLDQPLDADALAPEFGGGDHVDLQLADEHHDAADPLKAPSAGDHDHGLGAPADFDDAAAQLGAADPADEKHDDNSGAPAAHDEFAAQSYEDELIEMDVRACLDDMVAQVESGVLLLPDEDHDNHPSFLVHDGAPIEIDMPGEDDSGEWESMDVEARTAAQAERRDGLLTSWAQLSAREQVLLRDGWRLDLQMDRIDPLLDTIGAECSAECGSFCPAAQDSLRTMKVNSECVGDPRGTALRDVLTAIEKIECFLDARESKTVPARLQYFLQQLAADMTPLNVQLASQEVLPVLDESIEIVAAVESALFGVEVEEAREHAEDREVFSLLDGIVGVMDLLDEMVHAVDDHVTRGLPLPEIKQSPASPEKRRSVRFGDLKKFARESKEQLAKQVEEEEVRERKARKLEEAARRRSKLLELQAAKGSVFERPAYEYFPEHFKNLENASEIESSQRTASMSSFAESEDGDKDEDELADSDDESNAPQSKPGASVRDLFRQLKIDEKWAIEFEEQQLTVEDVETLTPDAIEELVSEKAVQKKLKEYTKMRQGMLKERLKDAKRQAHLMKRIAIPDTIGQLFDILKIPQMYADIWEAHGKLLSELPFLKDKELRKLLPQHGPRMRLKRFLEYHKEDIKKVRTQLLEKERERAKLERPRPMEEYARWREDRRAEIESFKKLQADQVPAQDPRFKPYADKEVIAPTIEEIEREEAVTQKVKPALKKESREDEKWRLALLMGERGYGSIEEASKVVAPDPPQDAIVYHPVKGALEEFATPKYKPLPPTPPRAERGCDVLEVYNCVIS